MPEDPKIALEILTDDLIDAGETYLPRAYASGKASAAAKSGIEIPAMPIDKDLAAQAVAFNSEQVANMMKQLDNELMSLPPSAYTTTAKYMEEVERVFDKYLNRQHAYVYYSEQAYLDGFIQGSKDIQDDLATEYGVETKQMGFFWRTSPIEPERTCPICLALDGQWFPIDDLSVSWAAHIGCRCPEFFEYAVNPDFR